jgi:GNAT superfamily N-acetyltransferase
VTVSSVEVGDPNRFSILPGDPGTIDSVNWSNLPSFMAWESPGNWCWGEIYELYPDLQVVLREGDEIVATMNSVPAVLCRMAYAASGYDDVLVCAVEQRDGDFDCLSLLSISVAAAHRGRGIPELLIRHAVVHARQAQLSSVIAPLRPTSKHRYPLIDIDEYVSWERSDGLVFDPWLRLHQRLGAEICGTARQSLVIRQRTDRWEQHIGFRMPAPGKYIVPGALCPIVVDEVGIGTYMEPSIWIRHAVDFNSLSPLSLR